MGAVIKGFILQDLIVSVAGSQNPLAVPVGDLLMSKKCFGYNRKRYQEEVRWLKPRFSSAKNGYESGNPGTRSRTGIVPHTDKVKHWIIILERYRSEK